MTSNDPARGRTLLAPEGRVVRQVRRLEPPPTHTPARTPAPGEYIDHYRIIEELGQGGMGVVLRAHDENLDREVAIKLVHPHLTARADIRRLFTSEARAMASVRHGNVVEIFAFGTHQGHNFFVMEYVPGCDLDTWVESRGPLAMDEVVGLLSQVCEGVQAIHDEGAVHRDLKPSNVLIGPAFRAKVADFGLASRVGTKSVHAGTPEFMAPEVLAGLELPELAPRIDVYALGVIGYELLTGRSPFSGDDVNAVIASQLEEVPAPVTDLRPDLPPAFREVFARALAKDPRDRTPSAEAFRAELHKARASRPTQAPPVRVALVEDDDDFAVWLVDTLSRKLPYVEIERFSDGDIALQHIPDGDFALAILDLDVPGSNGVELCASMRGHRSTADLPVVVCTGVGGPPEWELLRRLGADGFLVKPMDEASIVACVRRVLNRERQSGRAGGRRASQARRASR